MTRSASSPCVLTEPSDCFEHVLANDQSGLLKLTERLLFCWSDTPFICQEIRTVGKIMKNHTMQIFATNPAHSVTHLTPACPRAPSHPPLTSSSPGEVVSSPSQTRRAWVKTFVPCGDAHLEMTVGALQNTRVKHQISGDRGTSDPVKGDRPPSS